MKMSGKAVTRETQRRLSSLFTIRNMIIGAATSVGALAAMALSAQSRFLDPKPRPAEPLPSPFSGGGSASPDSGNAGSGSGDHFSVLLFLIVVAIVIAVLWLCFKIIGKATEESRPIGILLISIFVVIGSVVAYNSRDGGEVLAALLVSVIPVSIFICLPYLGIVYLRERAARRRKRSRMTS